MKITILGASSALQTPANFNTSHVVSVDEQLFLIDAGDGIQVKLRQFGIKISRLNHIFISHLHGDHCLGIVGILSSWAMTGRTGDVHIYAHADLETLLQPHIDYFCRDTPFSIEFHAINPRSNEVIFENKNVKVSTIPLKHGIPACGFLFEEKQRERHLIREKLDFYQIPIKDLQAIKAGGDWLAPDGKAIGNAELTRPADPPKRYAYCTDTAYYEKIIPLIEGADCLFHEATFSKKDAARAKENNHSTAEDAALIASKSKVKQLIIGHYSSRYKNFEKLVEEAQAIFPNTIGAREGMIVEI